MKRADFIHLVRLSEHASADNSRAYRRSVAVFAAVGYFWVLGCLALALALLAGTVNAIGQGEFKAGYIWLLVAAAGLLWTSSRALWCRLDAPQGVALSPAEAPALFEALEQIRRKIKGPPLHHVLLDSSFNASISQLPRYGLFGGAVNYLTIGLPLLLALDRPRFLAVMAHEYGHLRSDHGQFAAWIYRTRLSWTRLEQGLRHDEGPAAVATQAFLRWYFPRFLARTFALARQDEYEADRIAGQLLGKEVAAAALTEIAIKGVWISRKFWPLHWRIAATHAVPVGPFSAMRTLLTTPLPEDFARETLHQTLGEISDADDTHPVLRDRLQALEVSQHLPVWSSRPALDLLGASSAKWLNHFDRQWCQDNASGWTQHHAYLGRVRARIDQLAASMEHNNADEMVELGDLRRRLDPDAEVNDCYEQALRITPTHAGGLRGLAQCLKGTDPPRHLDCLDQLFDHSVANRWWACQAAVSLLEQPATDGTLHEPGLRLWRARLKQAEEAEGRAWAELTQTPFFQSITRHDLNDFEAGEFQSDMARCKPVARAWLVRKTLREFSCRRCYLLFVELPGMEDDDRHHLCRSLERTLDLPGPVLVLWAGQSPALADIQNKAFNPLFVRPLN
ncbi:M48 family metallopeptidase [Rhodoferax sp.]|uniref:M48 family metallopeptidase n=1 Tax=Rhodoferax sp. TaxID=50421 RepID=UPI001EB455E8|nr:M48 family metallopeptidase [Rhodoferax sp.]MBT9505596.1 M48 family metallopeptidase [Rhodoferax sp.]